MPFFRQLFDPTSATYTYLLADEPSREAVLIDPVFEQAKRDASLVEELDLHLVATLETHTHADHVTGAWLLRRKLGSRILVPRAGKASGADRTLAAGDRVRFGSSSLEVRETPGHTAGCVTFVLDDATAAFTGDALLVRGCGRTDFQEGDARRLYQSIHREIFTLPDSCAVYPGHDYRGLTSTSVGEERRFNPRLGEGIDETDFVQYMAHLRLPHPKLLAIALPANLRVGEPEGAMLPEAEPDWAPVRLTFGGVAQVEPRWLEEHLGEFPVVDVREPEEFTGTLGHVPGAVLVPLGNIPDGLGHLDPAAPLVTVCRSGARSAQASTLLQRAGFQRVANVAGGMLGWHAGGHAADGVTRRGS